MYKMTAQLTGPRAQTHYLIPRTYEVPQHRREQYDNMTQHDPTCQQLIDLIIAQPEELTCYDGRPYDWMHIWQWFQMYYDQDVDVVHFRRCLAAVVDSSLDLLMPYVESPKIKPKINYRKDDEATRERKRNYGNRNVYIPNMETIAKLQESVIPDISHFVLSNSSE